MLSKIDYGTPGKPNLSAISEQVSSELANYNLMLKDYSVSIEGDPVLELTPEKPNTARVVLPVLHERKKVGDLYVILFAPGDGTGSEVKQSEGGLTLDKVSMRMEGTHFNAMGLYGVSGITSIAIPSEYQHADRAERVLPRPKKKVLTEAFFPLTTVEGRWNYPGRVSLEELTVLRDGGYIRIGKEFDLGIPPHDYQLALQEGQKPAPPRIQLTCGYHRNGQRFGDPHAVYYNPQLAGGHLHRMQVAGFLSVEEAYNPLCKVLDRIAIAPQ